ncbi:pyruvate dehydrogenase (acetyl-transferring) E1 component subunit alpha [Rickettsiales bacterium LUAb2]
MLALKPLLSKSDASKFYHQMLLLRKFEEKAAGYYNMGKIAGFCHLYIGQEAVVTGIQSFATKTDSFITAYRDHAHAIVADLTPESVMAELFGHKEGSTGGKGGSMHFYNKKANFYGGHGIVGSSIPLGTGLAFAHKYNKDGGVSVAYVGDGAVLQGQVAEAFNMSSLWKLPAIYVIENNQYAMGTSIKRSHANGDLSSLGVPYNIKALKVDGMDLLDVLAKSEEAFKYVRSGNGPILLDVWTYRYRGHSMSDPAKYRSRDEVEKIRGDRDPIVNFVQYINKNNLLTESEIKQIDEDVVNKIKQIEEFLNTTSEPDPSTLYDNVFA